MEYRFQGNPANPGSGQGGGQKPGNPGNPGDPAFPWLPSWIKQKNGKKIQAVLPKVPYFAPGR
jgi:hypothetical protein